MPEILGIVQLLCAIGVLVTGIMMAIKMFQSNEVWQGILVIICWLFGVVYCWQKKDELGLGPLPLIYTLLGIVSIVLRFAIRSGAVN